MLVLEFVLKVQVLALALVLALILVLKKACILNYIIKDLATYTLKKVILWKRKSKKTTIYIYIYPLVLTSDAVALVLNAETLLLALVLTS